MRVAFCRRIRSEHAILDESPYLPRIGAQKFIQTLDPRHAKGREFDTPYILTTIVLSRQIWQLVKSARGRDGARRVYVMRIPSHHAGVSFHTLAQKF